MFLLLTSDRAIYEIRLEGRKDELELWSELEDQFGFGNFGLRMDLVKALAWTLDSPCDVNFTILGFWRIWNSNIDPEIEQPKASMGSSKHKKRNRPHPQHIIQKKKTQHALGRGPQTQNHKPLPQITTPGHTLVVNKHKQQKKKEKKRNEGNRELSKWLTA